jgi:hypothetical protein
VLESEHGFADPHEDDVFGIADFEVVVPDVDAELLSLFLGVISRVLTPVSNEGNRLGGGVRLLVTSPASARGMLASMRPKPLLMAQSM